MTAGVLVFIWFGLVFLTQFYKGVPGMNENIYFTICIVSYYIIMGITYISYIG